MELVALYERLATRVASATGLPDAMLHLHAGMALLLLARVLTRRSLGSAVPLAVVAAAALANEAMDWLRHESWRWSDTMPDLFNTLLWPTATFLVVRMRPTRSSGRRR